MPECTCEAYHRQHGVHREHCLRYVPEPRGAYREHRAVFSYPSSILGPTPDSYGPWRRTLAEAAKDRVPRSEETLGYRTGFQTRHVTIEQDEPVFIEIDAVPFMSNPGATEEDKDWARELHGTWWDLRALHVEFPRKHSGRFTTTPTGQIVYREDGTPAEVHTLRADWNRR